MSDPIAKLLAPGFDEIAKLRAEHEKDLHTAILKAADLAYAQGRRHGYERGYSDASFKSLASKTFWQRLGFA